VRGIAYGCGISDTEYGRMNLKEVFIYIEAVRKKQEYEFDQAMFITRLQTAYLLQPHAKKGRTIKPEKLWKLPSELKKLSKERKEYKGPSKKALKLFKYWDKVVLEESKI